MKKGKKKSDHFVVTSFTQDEVFERLSHIPDINENINKILGVLEGDMEDDKPGLVETMRQINERSKINRRYIVGLWTTITALTGSIMYFIIDIFKNIK